MASNRATAGPSTKTASGGQGQPAQIARWAFWIAAGAAAVVSVGPLIYDYWIQVWRSEHYQFAVLLAPAALVLAALRLYDAPLETGGPIKRLLAWSMALLLSAAAVFLKSPVGAAVALMAILFAALLECGPTVFRRGLPAWALLWLAVRPPFNIEQDVVTGLQSLATAWASSTLDVVGIRHLMSGVTIRLPGDDNNYFVDEACSGIHSLFAALAFTAFWSVATRRGLIRTVLMMLTSVCWVIVANAVRIIAIVVLSSRFGLPVTEGFGHTLIGLFTFALAVGLIVSTDRLFLFLVPLKEAGPIGQTPDAAVYTDAIYAEDAPKARKRRSVSSMGGGRGIVSPLAVSLCFAAIAVMAWRLPSVARTVPPPLASAEGFMVLAEGDLPERYDGWRRTGFDIVQREAGADEGELSRVWQYQKGRLVVLVSVDGPYTAWHDISICYTQTGFTLRSTDHEFHDDGSAHTALELIDPTGKHGLVLFSGYSEADNTPVTPPRARGGVWVQRIRRAFEERGSKQQVGGRVYQVQLLANSMLGFTETEQKEMEDLFHEMRDRVSSRDEAPEELPAAKVIHGDVGQKVAVATTADSE